jgi:hypothetical protein
MSSKRVWVCDQCKQPPSEHEMRRIERDLVSGSGSSKPARWLCPSCAPDLQIASSGLCFDVVDVGGCSPAEAE